MAKVSLDIDEIKKELKTRALQAASELTDLAKRAKHDLTQENVLKKVDEVVTNLKSQDFMKNPKVAELVTKIAALSEQVEKALKQNVAPLVDEVRARVNKAAGKNAAADETETSLDEVEATKAPKKKKPSKKA